MSSVVVKAHEVISRYSVWPAVASSGQHPRRAALPRASQSEALRGNEEAMKRQLTTRTWDVGQRCRELDDDVSVRRAHDVVQVVHEHLLDLA